MPAAADNKSCALHKISVQELSTVVDEDIIIEKKTNKLKGGDAVLIG
jgi:hypothetical protein